MGSALERLAKKHCRRAPAAATAWPWVVLLLTSLTFAAGTTETKEFYSRLLGRNTTYKIYLPPGYDTSTVRYPVIWTVQGRGPEYINPGGNMYDAYHATDHGRDHPLIGVHTDEDGSDKAQSNCGPTPVESYFVTELVPHIDSINRTMQSPFARGIAGHSKGGGGCVRIGLKYPHLFSVILPLDGWPELYEYNIHRDCPTPDESYWNFVQAHFPLLEQMPIVFHAGTMFIEQNKEYAERFTSWGLENVSVVDRTECGHDGVCKPVDLEYFFGTFNSRFVRGALPAPHVSPIGDPQRKDFKEPITVTITPAEPEQVVYYTTDGTIPTLLSRQYHEPFTISQDALVMARAYSRDGKDSSLAGYAEYHISPSVPTLSGLKPGVKFEYSSGKFDSTAQFRDRTPDEVRYVSEIAVPDSFKQGPWNSGERFTGYLRIEKAGPYHFYLGYDGGGVLRIDEQWVVGVDSFVPHYKVRAGLAWLGEGHHRITLDWLSWSDKPSMNLEIESTYHGIARQRIPASMLYNDSGVVANILDRFTGVRRRSDPMAALYDLKGRRLAPRQPGQRDGGLLIRVNSQKPQVVFGGLSPWRPRMH